MKTEGAGASGRDECKPVQCTENACQHGGLCVPMGKQLNTYFQPFIISHIFFSYGESVIGFRAKALYYTSNFNEGNCSPPINFRSNAALVFDNQSYLRGYKKYKLSRCLSGSTSYRYLRN